MTTIRERLDDAWDALAHGTPTASHILTHPTDIDSSAGPLRVAREADGTMHFLVPVPEATHVARDTRSSGVVVVPQVLTIGEQETVFADTVCVERDLAEVFRRLVETIAEFVVETPDMAGSAPARALQEWRELLRGAKAGLSREAETGLFGELSVLLSLVQEVGAAVLDTWKGPEGGVHDFLGPQAAIEVKSSTSREERLIKVHGLSQMDSEDDTILHLAFLRTLEDPEGRSVEDLVRMLEDAGLGRYPILGKLARVGWMRSREPRRFRIDERAFYLVGDDFPRLVNSSLVAGMLPVGVTGVTYTVDLAAAESCRVDFVEVAKRFRGDR